jgi:putative transposase
VPQVTLIDHSQELTGSKLDRRAYRNRVTPRLLQAGIPTWDAYMESFNGRFCDECLNEHWFKSFVEARKIIGTWRIDYNQRRQHTALGYQTPAGLTAAWRARNRARQKVGEQLLHVHQQRLNQTAPRANTEVRSGNRNEPTCLF